MPKTQSSSAPPDYETLASFRYAIRRFLHFSAEAAREVGLTPQQHQALLALKGFPGNEAATIGGLAESLQLRHNSTVGLVDRLAERKLVRRQHGVEDRRVVYVRLTSNGRALIRRLSSVHKGELRRIGPRLGKLISDLAEN